MREGVLRGTSLPKKECFAIAVLTEEEASSTLQRENNTLDKKIAYAPQIQYRLSYIRIHILAKEYYYATT